ncbi:hypothetical protein ACNHKD_08385 [Methylocystis sp. JAN1]|uniref:hypothetical protein n=1 Tax=Methylocystis sp. JAN1 TaxID=3397211 RepID=UPI003FA21438
MEIAFIAALVDIGRAPIVAVAIAERWLAKEARGELAPWWVENSFSGEGRFLGSSVEKITLAQLSASAPFHDDIGEGEIVSDETDTSGSSSGCKPATRLAAIHIAELVGRVDALFRPETAG